ncbi:hypothetical protein T492DRAFT_602756 [Pavlovales sp. CCMP2436]|nr:hypothetical protein T492DRAFT_602756 [Pavlovales sp. CCMP2436]|mmetsp:Transcript_38748/g.95799  ORF Transcript_38748/g.95799 Transcript_38748/m.95799 type:complete len:81 (-) Transcript_38748:342-584(-)
MCSKVACRRCKRPTWGGCGRHVDRALRGVPIADRCPDWESGMGGDCRGVPASGEPAAAKPVESAASAPQAGDKPACCTVQ